MQASRENELDVCHFHILQACNLQQLHAIINNGIVIKLGGGGHLHWMLYHILGTVLKLSVVG